MTTTLDNDKLEYLRRYTRRRVVTSAIELEMERQFQKWGDQNHRNGTGPNRRLFINMNRMTFKWAEEEAKQRCAQGAKWGTLTWKDILLEEVFEACAEADPEKLEAELVQVAAVCASWINAIHRAKALATAPVGE